MIVGKETLPILIGEEKTLLFLKFLCLGTMILVSLAGLSGLLPLWALGLLIAFGYQGLLLIIYEKKWALPGSVFFETLIESGFILAGLIALLSHFGPITVKTILPRRSSFWIILEKETPASLACYFMPILKLLTITNNFGPCLNATFRQFFLDTFSHQT